jgi:phosphoribosylformylglycinamidine (FGAM) synthase-like enzyme
MLTREEKELLEALKGHMDDEQKEALSEMPEKDIKEFLKEAKKEVEKEMEKVDPHTLKGQFRFIRDAPVKAVLEEYQGSPLGALFMRLLFKMASTKIGCGILIVATIVLLITIMVGNT